MEEDWRGWHEGGEGRVGGLCVWEWVEWSVEWSVM